MKKLVQVNQHRVAKEVLIQNWVVKIVVEMKMYGSWIQKRGKVEKNRDKFLVMKLG